MNTTSPQLFHIPVEVVDVSGPDAATYLHGQLSQDISGLDIGQSAFSLLLAPQGFVEAWFRVIRRGSQQYWLVVDAGYAEAAGQRLERFKLRVDCEITVHQNTLTAVRWGPSDDGIEIAGVLADHQNTHIEIGTRWSDEPGFDIVGPTEIAVGGAELASIDAFERMRIAAKRPAMGIELTDKTIPAAAGIVDRSVDFAKGCYVGQELVARVDSRGNNTPTRLYRIDFANSGVAAGDVVFSETGEAGKVTSAIEGADGSAVVALAYLKRGADLSKVWVNQGTEENVGEVVED